MQLVCVLKIVMLLLFFGITTKSIAHADGFTIANVSGQGVFYRNNSVFMPRGANYLITNLQGSSYMHDTMQPGASPSPPYNYYNPGPVGSAASVLSSMSSWGYNVVRVNFDCAYLDGDFILSNPYPTDAQGSYPFQSWINDVVVNFLQTARQYNMYVLFTVGNSPKLYMNAPNYNPNNDASTVAAPYQASGNVDGDTVQILDPGHAQARAQFWVDVINGVKVVDSSLLNNVLGIDIWGEAHVNSASNLDEPFSDNSQYTINGQQYLGPNCSNTLSSCGAVNLANQAGVLWFNYVAGEIKKADPNILVTTSLNTPGIFNRNSPYQFPGSTGENDYRYPLSGITLANYSIMDYLEYHFYLISSSYSVFNDLNTTGLSQNSPISKPIIVSEFDVLTSAQPSVAYAASAALQAVSGSCRFGFSGWVYYTWNNPTGNSQYILDDPSNYMQYLSPYATPNPCN